jgi:hypothetical protein
VPLTLDDYMNPARFPLTTQGGLTPRQQMLIDAVNLGDVQRAEEEGRALDPDRGPLVDELTEKGAARTDPGLMGEVRRRERAAAGG